ncbi:MAG: SOS response-associated peptidase family protein, partial [Bdellovibrionota bacterium]|nr:SOS response-associated peptidase family protein [Bdellovibrionota bacterium]
MKIERDLKKLSAFFNAMPVPRAFQELKRGTQEFPKVFKIPGEDNIIYPNIFAPVIVYASGQKFIRPMRYRIRPAGSREEVPTKYNLFNARLDSLLKKKTWKRLVGVNHCLFPFREFYEWVPGGENG